MHASADGLKPEDLQGIIRPWGLGPIQRAARTPSGLNNENWVLETAEGSFVLRVYRNADTDRYIRFEHALLAALGRCSMTFAVPVPIPTPNSETFVHLGERPACLTRLIPGRHPSRDDMQEVRLAGQALGELDAVLAELTITHPSPAGGVYGERAIHPAISGPEEAAELLHLSPMDRKRYDRLVTESEAAWPGLRRTLPGQAIHADYAVSNVLLQDGSVSGVLDFEFAGPDLRAMDLAIGLYGFLYWREGWPSEGFKRVDVFADGYAEHVSLGPQEIAALPALLLRRNLVVFWHWAGRWKIGLSPETDVRERFARAVDLQDWLDQHGGELVDRMGARLGGGPI